MSLKLVKGWQAFWQRLVPQSLIWRLSAVLSVVLLLVLGIALTVFYRAFSRDLLREDQLYMNGHLTNIAVLIQSDPDWPKLISEMARSTVDNPNVRLRLIRIYSDQEVAVQTPGIDQLLPVEAFPSLAFNDVSPVEKREIRSLGRNFTVASARVDDGAPVPKHWIVQMAIDDTQEYRMKSELISLAALVMVASIATMLLVGHRVVRQGLRPLDRIAAAAERITAKRLDERLGGAPWPAELVRLSTIFDGMLARLQQSFEQLSQYSANLAHEIRTPINNIMGHAEVALTRPRSDQDYQQVLVTTVEECQRLTRLIDNLLFLARADSRQLSVTKVSIVTEEMLIPVVDYYAPLAEERGIVLSRRGEGSVKGDPTLLQRAVSNILQNALYYSPPGSGVEIAVERTGTGEETCLSVIDTGPGIDEADLPFVFERSYRAQHSQASRPEGMGLGLSIAKSIAELHGGRIMITSRKGLGTRVDLIFPD